MIVWEKLFNSGDLAWVMMSSLVAAALCLYGYWHMMGHQMSAESRDRLTQQLPLLLAALVLAWCGWIYSLAFAPSWGTVPQSSEVNPASMASLGAAMASADAAADRTREIGRGGVVGGFDYIAMAQAIPMAGTHGPAFPLKNSEQGIPSLAMCILHLSTFLIAVLPLTLAWGREFTGLRLAFLLIGWSTIVYAPVAHAIAGDGWLFYRGALDASQGILFLAMGCSLLLIGRGQSSLTTAPPGMTLGMMTFGLGVILFQGAHILHADGRTALAMVNAMLGLASGVLTWSFCTSFLWCRRHTDNLFPAVFAGSAAMSCCGGYVVPQSAVIIGALAGAIGNLLDRCIRKEEQIDRGIAAACCTGATVGLLGVGVFATTSAGGMRWDGRDITGLLQGEVSLIQYQAVAIAAVVLWTLVATYLLNLLVSFSATNRPEHNSQPETPDQAAKYE